MFKTILIANRGEIACRIIATAKQMELRTIAVYSDVDAKALHVTMADEAYALGGAAAAESYLDIKKIINVALKSGAEAIHPGYGFLSENAEFCGACTENNIIFVGPDVSALEIMGSKAEAKKRMAAAKVPLIPGYQGDEQSPGVLSTEAKAIGYPVLIKASAGGGGKGMRLVNNAEQFDESLQSAQREAKQGFGDDHVILEKYLPKARHVEVQVFCDQHGNGVYLGDRDCSMQRRHQKILEEAPAPGLSDELRQAMGEAAVRAALAIKYCGAGTVEFLLADKDFYFMEMNTRLQVEHPVTEMVTGQDLVAWQFKVAAGESLPLTQNDIHLQGHAIEARIYAEDCDNGFLPSSGKIKFLRWPDTSETVRIDTGVRQGDIISNYYDPMIAKLIVRGDDRAQALNRLAVALSGVRIAGPQTNLVFLSRLLACDTFQQASLYTSYVDQNLDAFKSNSSPGPEIVVTAVLALLLHERQREAALYSASHSPWHMADYWRLNTQARRELTLRYGEQVLETEIDVLDNAFAIKFGDIVFTVSGTVNDQTLIATIEGQLSHYPVFFTEKSIGVFVGNQLFMFDRQCNAGEVNRVQENDNSICSPMHGKVIAVAVKPGDSVVEGQKLAVIEAMKMEHTLRAPFNATAEQIHCVEDELVEKDAVLIELLAEKS